jgi:hypothetical protein
MFDANEILTGDIIMERCDIILTNLDKLNFHKDIEHLRFKMLDIDREDYVIDFLNSFLTPIKLFVYTDHVKQFKSTILPHLKNKIILVIGNGDLTFDDTEILDNEIIKKGYIGNLNVIHEKATLLPIGLENKMWNKDNIRLIKKYQKINVEKTESVFICMNPNTWKGRKEILQFCKDRGLKVYEPDMNYERYLYEMKKHKYCLCIRGNGMDCHRFYEALYLGVKPIILNDEYSSMDWFVKNLHKLNIDFVEIKDVKDLLDYK